MSFISRYKQVICITALFALMTMSVRPVFSSLMVCTGNSNDYQALDVVFNKGDCDTCPDNMGTVPLGADHREKTPHDSAKEMCCCLFYFAAVKDLELASFLQLGGYISLKFPTRVMTGSLCPPTPPPE